MKVLLLESSTASAKAMLYDSEKGILKVCSQAYDKSICDIVTQDAQGVVDAVLKAGRECAAGEDVAAVALSGIWHSLLVCDKNAVPKSRILTWAHIKASKQAESVRAAGRGADIYSRTGCPVNALYPLYKAMLLKQEGAFNKDDRIMAQGDYLFLRLTGEYLTSDCLASGSSLFNLGEKDYDSELLLLCGIERGQLPKAVDYRTTAPLSDEAAGLLGIAPGIPVVTAHADGALNQVGAGGLKKGVLSFSVGTSGAMRMAADTPVTPERGGTWCYMGPGTYLCGAATQGACNCVDWFAGDILGGSKGYRELEDAITFKDDNPYFLPFIFGERCPGWNETRRGGFTDIAPGHGAPEMFYAILEGVLFNLYQCYEILTQAAGVPEVIKLSGGVVKSRLWSSMLLSIWDREISVDGTDQASMLGAAALALHAAGGLSDISSFDTKGGRPLEGQADKTGYFKKRYERYKELYKLLA